ncbi:MAG: YiiX/YebB-like N1pC/P60 family cysteine hydrolase [Myxococcales bacterium]|nr:YiiX/YebB-like N1pC/P60 family cysteine hydrolase [Myxococcales bacterium]
MVLLLSALLSAAPTSQPSVFTLEGQPFVDSARSDLATLKMFVQGLKSVNGQVQANKALFALKAETVLTPDQKRTILSTWGSLFGYFSSIEGLRQKYWDFVKVLPTDVRHAWGYVITHTALTAVLAYGLAFADLTLGNKQLETLLDEANDEFGVPAGAFAAFKMKSIHVATSTQLMTGDAWSLTVTPMLKKAKAFDEKDVKWAWDEMKADSKLAKSSLTKNGARLYAVNATDILKDSTMHTVFPVQKSFAEWMGDTRVARNGKPLVTKEFVEKIVLPKLQPGDVLVARQNWFLSNIGLPGFWPHALLYVGRPEQWAAIELDPGVQTWLKAQPEKPATFSELLQKRYPAKWKSYAEGTDFQGHGPLRVIESISEGVSFTAIEHAMGVDYLGALRPRNPLVEKARAIERAFRYQGRPYDFDFDFFSDSSLVCTELVYKAYQQDKDMKGLEFPLVDVAGRRTLPANEIIKRFDLEAEKPDRQLDFVLFVDAKEKDGTVFEASAQSLRDTWKRLKWDVAQK